MTVDEIKAALTAIGEERDAIQRREWPLRLALEEAEGRGNSRDARWMRALLCDDLKAASECFEEWKRENDAKEATT